MSVSVAIIYTGEVRTIETTIAHFKENVLLHNRNMNTNTNTRHVFAVLQTPTPAEFFDEFVRNSLGNSLKSLEWFDPDNPEWTNVKEETLRTITVHDHWKDYLRRSGSIVEYYQMYLAYRQIAAYETAHNMKYDYIMRIRCDVVPVYPLFFDWDDKCTIDAVRNHLYNIKSVKSLDTIISRDAVLLFMNTFYHPDRLNTTVKVHYDNYPVSPEFHQLFETTNEDRFIADFHQYLLRGKYIITLRQNQIYFIKRQFFDEIATLGITYGKRVMPEKAHWFDAESQFQTVCVKNGIDVFDSTTETEGQSLYNYQPDNYFKEDGELIRTRDCLFFIKRR